ncbi:hypothetical protein [Streptomyces sp. NBC_01803]|uniref:hypothetical protein n=1 Tax=Streptomyces sp. NBC_01803 TaxID=2975946 RepID=UPI002DD989E3|nr:hypothetical protein [Streptomyces sp. NBC_01803]WSA46960.1 hypothetical protein OIE51_23940 [Streptomyces sp. NBC_01803]
MIRIHGHRPGGARRAAAFGCALVIVSLLCALGLAAPGAAAVDHGAGQPGAEIGLRTQIRVHPLMDPVDFERPGSTCHVGPGTPADPLPPPPLALHVPAPDPAPPAARSQAAPGITGAANDGAHSVDLHRLRVQRT